MKDYRPVIDDPTHLSRLAGHRYVLLRPIGEVANVFASVQTSIRERFPDLAISYPAQAHVTLKGFPAGTSLAAVQALVQTWGAETPVLHVAVEHISLFPAPFKIVIVQVQKTVELFNALARLTSLAEQLKFPDWPTGTVPSVNDWIFHMSVAYCSTLGDADWSDVTSFSKRLIVPSVQCPVDEVEVTAFDEGQEYSGGVFPLGRL